MTAVCDAAGSVMQVNATTVGPGLITGPGAGFANEVSLGISAATLTSAVDIAELSIWPKALIGAERDAHRAAMKAKYTAPV